MGINSSSNSNKSQLIVETATDLFMRYGVKRVTVEEICQTAKISKMTFYKYFKNKKVLAEHIIYSILDYAQIEFDAIWNEVSTFTVIPTRSGLSLKLILEIFSSSTDIL